jgi:hypothetical protein
MVCRNVYVYGLNQTNNGSRLQVDVVETEIKNFSSRAAHLDDFAPHPVAQL